MNGPDTLPPDRVLDGTALGDDRTIAAIATAIGRGALATIRISGPAVVLIADRLLDPPPTQPRRATRARLLDLSTGLVLDDVIATFYRAPHSFTGEDVLEISTHGGALVPTSVLASLLRAGVQEAEPGEFTRRAVLNGKLDLLQAEAIGDLIEARSTAEQRQALRQLDGGLTTRVLALRQQILQVEALLAYDIDFPEEDDGPIPQALVARAADEALKDVRALLATADQGTLIHDGALIVFAGAPNAGKSSLFNGLLGESRAIVTSIPGTTRDAIEAVLDRPSWPLRLVDMAGLRDTTDEIERLGIEMSTRYLGRAALVLACGDHVAAVRAVAQLVETMTSAPVLHVLTKADLVSDRQQLDQDLLLVSAHTGEGLQVLLEAIDARLMMEHGLPMTDAPGLTRARHRAAVVRATAELSAFNDALQARSIPASIAAIHIRAAAESLAELIGIVRTDDVLDVVFRQFCVGK